MKRGLVSLLLAAVVPALAQTQNPAGAGIGYASVASAMQQLRAKAGARVQETSDGWTIISEPGDIQWSFTPAGHSAHPAVVRRTIRVDPDGMLRIEMRALCEAEREPCDRLVREFQAVNDRIRQSVQAPKK